MHSRPVIVAVLALGVLLAGCGSGSAASSSAPTSSAPTSTAASIDSSTATAETSSATSSSEPASIDCTPGASLVEQTEGPYYTPGAPERTDITDGAPGTPLELIGYVLDADCNPVAGATIEFWQADGEGVYDNTGFVLRGTQKTDAQGAYMLTTVIPGQYPGRTEHIHVKVAAPGGATFATQLYFPESTANAQDGIYVESMEITVMSYDQKSMDATFDFVLPA